MTTKGATFSLPLAVLDNVLHRISRNAQLFSCAEIGWDRARQDRPPDAENFIGRSRLLLCSSILMYEITMQRGIN